MSRKLIGAVLTTALLGISVPAIAATDSRAEIAALKAQNNKLEAEVRQLAAKVEALAEKAGVSPVAAARATPAKGSPDLRRLENRVTELEQQSASSSVEPEAPQAAAPSSDSAFNPAISAVLNGHYASFTGHEVPVGGFGAGEEGGRISQGLGIDEAEIGLSSNVDDKFSAAIIASLSEEDGETSVELEEAYIRTLGLPGGLGVMAGRFLEPVGYINEHHAHTDDFADRSLPNRVFLNGAYKDDGVLASWILPTDFYAAIGGGVFHGGDFPAAGGHGNGAGSWLAYARTGGDIGQNQNWLFGLSTLQTRPEEREGNDGNVLFTGNSDLYAASLRYVWDPTGNSKMRELTLQGEYFWRHENGNYEDIAALTGAVPYDDSQSGWYAQGVYKFAPQWRIGTRFSMLNAPDVPAGLAGSELDSGGHDPWNAAVMGDWTNSEFSRLRLQYQHEEPSKDRTDNGVVLQYIMSIGAHPAHTF